MAAHHSCSNTRLRRSATLVDQGGGFGAKSPYALAHDAAGLAKIAGRPVRVAFTRHEETMWSNFRPAAIVQIKSGSGAAGLDPVEVRLRNLSEPRFRRVLEATADAFGWTGPRMANGHGAGIALGIDVGSYVATAAEVSVQEKEVRVHRVAAALDCGLVVNPEGAANQMEGSIVMGLGGALFEASDLQDGRLLNATFARYRVPRIVDAPQIDVRFVGDDTTPSTGAGEPGIVPIAAAISGAVYGATGQRHRELPIQRHL